MSQDYPNLEYIIIDGGSKDGTLAIIDSYKTKLKFISEPDKGIYDAMNKGLHLATGDIIGFIGADDFYPSANIVSLVAEAFKNNDVDSLYGDVQFVHPEDTSRIVRYWKQQPYKKENWLNGFMPPHLSFFLKKDAYVTYGHYLTHFKCAGDYELMLRMLYKNNLSSLYIPKTLMTMRAGGTSNASLKHRLVANLEDRQAWKLNNLKPKWYTLLWKPLSKISQLIIK